jgi:mannose-6-phosphate isomerase-like protein (cupin superfamily)
VYKEKLLSGRSSSLRKNNSKKLELFIDKNSLTNIFLINGNSFKTINVKESDLIVDPHENYMIINNGWQPIDIDYNLDVSDHQVLYDPYLHENSEKINFTKELFLEKYDIPKNYIDTLPKWYSFKFTYPNYNLIFVKPEFGLSIQFHKNRVEFWEILDGEPIIINEDKIYYYVKNGMKFENKINSYHSVINPNKGIDEFVLIKERWKGIFDENDIQRIFNPNDYF